MLPMDKLHYHQRNKDQLHFLYFPLQKGFVQRFFTLQQQGMIAPTVTMSDVTEWLLQRGRNIFMMRKANRLRSVREPPLDWTSDMGTVV